MLLIEKTVVALDGIRTPRIVDVGSKVAYVRIKPFWFMRTNYLQHNQITRVQSSQSLPRKLQ